MKRFRQSFARQNRDSGVGVSFVDESEDEDEVRDQPRRSLGRRSHQPADISVRMAKAEVGLHMYSGHPKDTRYNDGNVERYTADAWCTRLEMVASSAGWSSKVQAANAALALTPGSPADRWFQVVKDDDAVKDWPGFKARFLKEFMPEESVMEKISLLNSMTQEKNERVSDFKNKLTGKMEKFKSGMETMWAEDKYTTPETATAALKGHREMVLGDVIDYLSRLMFVSGLEKDLQLDVAKSSATTLEEMVEVARKSETAFAAVRGGKKQTKSINAIEDERQSGSVKEQIAALVAAELDARAKGSKGAGGNGTKSKKKKAFDVSKVGCYYCLEYGHFSSDCERRKKDRDADIWRPTVKDPKMSKSEFYALSQEERNKGKEIMSKGKAGPDSRAAGGVAGLSKRAEERRQGESNTAFWMSYNTPEN